MTTKELASGEALELATYLTKSGLSLSNYEIQSTLINALYRIHELEKEVTKVTDHLSYKNSHI